MGCCGERSNKQHAQLELDSKSPLARGYTRVDGHTGMQFQGDILAKVTKEAEAANYEAIFDPNQQDQSLVKLRPFLSEFRKSEPNPDKADKKRTSQILL